MSDDWLRHGHELDGVELTRVLSSSSVLADRADASSPPRWTSGWRGVVVGGAVAVLATLGVVGVANAIGDNLFPSLGPTSPASVWQNPVPPTDPVPADDDAPTATTPTTAPAIAPTIPPTTEAAPPSTVAAPALSPAQAPALSPATSTPKPETDDDDVTTTTLSTQLDDDGPDDQVDDDGSSGSSGSSGSGSDDSGSGSDGSDDASDDD